MSFLFTYRSEYHMQRHWNFEIKSHIVCHPNHEEEGNKCSIISEKKRNNNLHLCNCSHGCVYVKLYLGKNICGKVILFRINLQYFT